MKFSGDRHLAYCTNIHRGESWPETFHALNRYTLAVKARVCPNQQYAIGLRLSARAAKELSDSSTLLAFRQWLDNHNCYVFTINGFPYGNFHGERIKEQVFLPDWSAPERLEYTKLLFDILCQLLPSAEVAGSVSTLPGSFKRFVRGREQYRAILDHLRQCAHHIESLSRRHQRDLHLGLEPEPLGLLETSAEAVDFFTALRQQDPLDDRIDRHLGITYDTCHLAVEFESAKDVIAALQAAGIRVSKIHLSSALKITMDTVAVDRLLEFRDDVYLHQVVAKRPDGSLCRYEDLPLAVEAWKQGDEPATEWRIHYHIPIHRSPLPPLASTQDHVIELLDVIRDQPSLCRHFEMETYTWDVLPAELRASDVVEQLAHEYEWIIRRLNERDMAMAGKTEFSN